MRTLGKDLSVEGARTARLLAWKDHDAYQRAFDRLLRDLKAEAG